MDHPNVAIRPPLLFAAGFAAGAILELVLPLGPGLAGGGLRPVLIGIAILLIGVGLSGSAVARFRRAGTNIQTVEPALALVTDGPYRLSRNPIYIGLTIAYLGLSIAMTTLWALIVLPAVLQILHHRVVMREEVYLEEKFPRAYGAYTQRVPRWI